MARPGKRASGNCPSPASLPSRTSSSSPKPTRAMDITPPASPSSIEQTAKHLREAGFREDTVAMSSTEQATFCACAAPESEFDIEEAIKCFNRNVCPRPHQHLSLGISDISAVRDPILSPQMHENPGSPTQRHRMGVPYLSPQQGIRPQNWLV